MQPCTFLGEHHRRRPTRDPVLARVDPIAERLVRLLEFAEVLVFATQVVVGPSRLRVGHAQLEERQLTHPGPVPLVAVGTDGTGARVRWLGRIGSGVVVGLQRLHELVDAVLQMRHESVADALGVAGNQGVVHRLVDLREQVVALEDRPNLEHVADRSLAGRRCGVDEGWQVDARDLIAR
jgi:hypothetical protein